MRVLEIGFQFHISSKKENILSDFFLLKSHDLAKNHKFLEFSKSLYYTLKMQYFDHQNIFE